MKNHFSNLIHNLKIITLVTILFLFSIPGFAQKNQNITDTEKQVLFNTAIKLMYSNYIFPDRIKKIETMGNQKFGNGGYREQSEFAGFLKDLNKDFESWGNDHHLNIFYEPEYVMKIRAAEKNQTAGTAPVPAEFINFIQYENFFLKKIERLDGNIGYFKFNKFEDLAFAKESISGAMNLVSHSSAIIIDLRQNGGGSAETVHFLMNYFLPDSTKLGQFKRRINNEVIDLWTVNDPMIKKIPDSIPLFVIVSKQTSSAAESFAYGLQQFRRATVIGEKTHGEGNPGKRFVVNDELTIMIPTATSTNIITGTNWEGTGVIPNIEIQANLALQKALLESCIYLAKNAKLKSRKQFYEWMIFAYQVEIQPQTISAEYLKSITGEYEGGARIEWENGILFFVPKSGKYKMTYMADNVFAVEGKDYRIRFPKGSPTYYEAYWMDGGGEKSNRQRN